MNFGESEIQQLMELIWDQMLKLPVTPLHAVPAAAGARTLSGCVTITGAWRGAVAISCSAAMASQAAVVMFGHDDASTVTAADQQDALGELVNMLGGNIKALLPEPCQLSLPAVTQGADFTVRVPKTRLMQHVAMQCGKEPLTISLLESEELAKAA